MAEKTEDRGSRIDNTAPAMVAHQEQHPPETGKPLSAEDVILALENRGIAVPEELILATRYSTNRGAVDIWAQRAATVTSAEELLKVKTSTPLRPVFPSQGNDYSDAFWAHLYSNMCNFGMREVQVIWSRYSVFMLANSITLSFAAKGMLLGQETTESLGLLSVAGSILCVCWYLMNYFGWKNQDFWYWHASRVRFILADMRMPTEPWERMTIPPLPSGNIYGYAQVVVLMFGGAYGYLLFGTLSPDLGPRVAGALIWFLLLYFFDIQLSKYARTETRAKPETETIQPRGRPLE